jgi:hypothetical protein
MKKFHNLGVFNNPVNLIDYPSYAQKVKQPIGKKIVRSMLDYGHL